MSSWAIEHKATRAGKSIESRGSIAGVPLLLLTLGLVLRLGNAAYRFLNPDEALHYLLSLQPSFAATYQATLTTAHPPLLILILHAWGRIAHSELFLRLPSVAAGTLFCAVMFGWLKRVSDRTTALLGLAMLLFSPALIQVSSEVRQYGLLLLFCSVSLYWLDGSVIEDSIALLLLSTLALYLALLTHYSAFIVAFTLAGYGLMRLFTSRARSEMFLVWVLAQLGAMGLVLFSYFHHIARIRAGGLPA
ncbi:MAG: glycosyltransferase family 39 protein, partial [Acidobacteria bacterium]|nr:glycosyltransferase family 39 protein [Acidobacteriota bacterium]